MRLKSLRELLSKGTGVKTTEITVTVGNYTSMRVEFTEKVEAASANLPKAFAEDQIIGV